MRIVCLFLLCLAVGGCAESEDAKHAREVAQAKQSDLHLAEHGNPIHAYGQCMENLSAVENIPKSYVYHADRTPFYEDEQGGYKFWMQAGNKFYICHFNNADDSVKFVKE